MATITLIHKEVKLKFCRRSTST